MPRKYTQKHKEMMKIYRARWLAKHPEVKKALRKRWREKWAARNPNYKPVISDERRREINEYQKARIAALAAKGIKRVRTPEQKAKLSAANAARYLRKKEEIKAYVRKHKKEHPELYKTIEYARRAKKRGTAYSSDQSLIVKWEREWRKKRRVRCNWCRGSFSPKKCHLDHVTPLSKGGKHSIENVCISCQPCNNQKHAKSLEAWNAKLAQPVLF